MLDIFNDDAFSTHSLTEAINIAPYKPRRLGAMGLFQTKNPRTHTVLIERKGEVLSILESKPRGSGETNKRPATRRDLIPFYIPHFPLDDAVLPADVAGVREFGTEDQLEIVSGVVNEKLTGMRSTHEITHEYLRVGAVKGIVLDGDAAASELLNLFEAFNFTQEEFYFDLEADGTTLKRTCIDAIQYIEDILGGETYDYIHALVGNEFFQDLVNNDEVKVNYAEQTNFRFPVEQQGTGTMGRGTSQVWFGDILFENYRGKVGSRDFIGTNDAHLFPVGVSGLFQTHFGPANTMSDINTAGRDIYVMQEPMEFDSGVKLRSESNPLTICTRPKLLVKGHAGAES